MYYQGDYYQGDYYQGDPFLGALIGGAVSWLGKKIFKRKLSPSGQATLAKRIDTRGGQMVRSYSAPLAAGAIASGMTIPLPGPYKMTPRNILPGGRPLFSREQMGPPAPPGAAAGCCPAGYHVSGRTGACVKNRRMNVANPKALRRSLRRVAGFGKMAQRAKRDIKRAAKAVGA